MKDSTKLLLLAGGAFLALGGAAALGARAASRNGAAPSPAVQTTFPVLDTGSPSYGASVVSRVLFPYANTLYDAAAKIKALGDDEAWFW